MNSHFVGEKMKAAPGWNKFRTLQVTSIIFGIIGLAAFLASKFSNGRLIVILTVAGLVGFLITAAVLAVKIKHFWKALGVLALDLLLAVGGAYLLMIFTLLFFQDTIADRTSTFFQPTTLKAEAAQEAANANVEALSITAPDGVQLNGWLVDNADSDPSPLMIVFNGSGSESSGLIPYVKYLEGWKVALVNYRGFGTSEGTPGRQKVMDDALVVFDALSARADIDPGRIVSMGYSLGTGVAAYLSDQRATAGTILVAPYDKLTLIGFKRSPAYAPFAGIMRPFFDSATLAPGIKTPLLVLMGSLDTNVPPELSRRLAELWGGDAKVVEFPGEDHGLLFHSNSSWQDIQVFLTGLD
jgi:pimeloyl-ACP methyl ester carboxylesterase